MKTNKREKAKDFCLKNQNNELVCLKALLRKYKYAVVYFYPKDFTPGCTTEATEFSKHYKEFEKLNTVIVGISKDSVESHKKFCEKHNLKGIILLTDDKNVAELYNAYGKKKLYGKEYEGIIRKTFLIDKNMHILHKWEKVKPKGHALQVLEKIKQLAGEK